MSPVVSKPLQIINKIYHILSIFISPLYFEIYLIVVRKPLKKANTLELNLPNSDAVRFEKEFLFEIIELQYLQYWTLVLFDGYELL